MTLFERDDRIGGLLRYGIPDFKMEKWLIDRRMEQMAAEGVTFRTGVHVGVDVTGDELRREFDAIVLSTRRDPSARPARARAASSRASTSPWSSCRSRTRSSPATRVAGQILATGKRVVILGGGDTGSDCLGTSNRHGATSVHQFELLPAAADGPPAARRGPTGR